MKNQIDDCVCEYKDCGRAATHVEDCGIREQIPLCDDHSLDDKTGYCSQSCQLGYGCDDSC
jgi:hypothetical protein